MRCRRCERMYDEAQPVECRYHPGRYGANSYALVPHWSCCGNEMQLGGCRTAIEHVPCETTRRAMLSFVCPPANVSTPPSISDIGPLATSDDGAPDDGAAPGAGRTLVFEMPDTSLTTAHASTAAAAEAGLAQAVAHKAAEALRAAPAPVPSPVPASRPAQAAGVPADATLDGRYVVLPSDTFRSVALRHGMSVEALAEMNGMRATRFLMPGQVLRIVQPALSDEDEEARRRRQMVLKFRRLQQCSVEEARYYCETNEFKWHAAVAERQADVAWEREHRTAESGSVQQVQAAEREAALLVAALACATSRGAKAVWPTWLRPWEDQLVRRCLVGSD